MYLENNIPLEYLAMEVEDAHDAFVEVAYDMDMYLEECYKFDSEYDDYFMSESVDNDGIDYYTEAKEVTQKTKKNILVTLWERLCDFVKKIKNFITGKKDENKNAVDVTIWGKFKALLAKVKSAISGGFKSLLHMGYKKWLGVGAATAALIAAIAYSKKHKNNRKIKPVNPAEIATTKQDLLLICDKVEDNTRKAITEISKKELLGPIRGTVNQRSHIANAEYRNRFKTFDFEKKAGKVRINPNSKGVDYINAEYGVDYIDAPDKTEETKKANEIAKIASDAVKALNSGFNNATLALPGPVEDRSNATSNPVEDRSNATSKRERRRGRRRGRRKRANKTRIRTESFDDYIYDYSDYINEYYDHL